MSAQPALRPEEAPRWFIALNGQKLGPLLPEEIKVRIEDPQHPQSVGPSTKVWRRGLKEWVEAQDTPELGPLFGPPPLDDIPPLDEPPLLAPVKDIAPVRAPLKVKRAAPAPVQEIPPLEEELPAPRASTEGRSRAKPTPRFDDRTSAINRSELRKAKREARGLIRREARAEPRVAVYSQKTHRQKSGGVLTGKNLFIIFALLALGTALSFGGSILHLIRTHSSPLAHS